MNYDTIKNLNLKYELIDKNKSYSYHTDDGTHIVELYLPKFASKFLYKLKF